MEGSGWAGCTLITTVATTTGGTSSRPPRGRMEPTVCKEPAPGQRTADLCGIRRVFRRPGRPRRRPQRGVPARRARRGDENLVSSFQAKHLLQRVERLRPFSWTSPGSMASAGRLRTRSSLHSSMRLPSESRSRPSCARCSRGSAARTWHATRHTANCPHRSDRAPAMTRPDRMDAMQADTCTCPQRPGTARQRREEVIARRAGRCRVRWSGLMPHCRIDPVR